ncbi:MAG: hypothetical protein M1823_002718 [Watsoniomyces obsoletus]|nr:MAG: hypothetical protein M1823_002718 [Watsoniomyces obsoletus]
MRGRRNINRQRGRQFKAAHARLLGILTWVFFLHITGIYLFTKGFLLTRLVLDHQSTCDGIPEKLPKNALDERDTRCWHPRSFEKAVVIIIDALRYDFTIPFKKSEDIRTPHYRNGLHVLYQTAAEEPHNAFLLPFIADPPTATLQRLKGLTTGTLPTFVDAGSNFAGTAIEEDNLIAQLRDAGKNVVHLGDDTWHSLFPGYFDANLSKPYDSFNVWDLHTVDNGVTHHLLPLLHSSNTSRWDVIIGHYLGVDHAGHRYGPDHPAMAAKLQQMDVVLRQVIAALDDSTLLVVMGDHGMDVKGDHGGESDDEIEAALWMYSKKGIFGRTSPDAVLPPSTAKERRVWQIDLVPTLSLLLGLPIPFNNLGAPIAEAFIGRNGTDWKNLATVAGLSNAQIFRYQHEYTLARGLPENVMATPQGLWKMAHEQWTSAIHSSKESTISEWRRVYQHLSRAQEANLRVCKDLWARFDIPSMIAGILVMFGGVLVIIALVGLSARGTEEIYRMVITRIIQGTMGGLIFGVSSSMFLPFWKEHPMNAALLGVTMTSSTTVLLTIYRQHRLSIPIPTSGWTWLAILFTISQSLGFASNSFTIWEDEILLFFLTTFGVLATIHSFQRTNLIDRVQGMYQSILFTLLTRLASLARLCREEQMPQCRSTYYASSNSSTSAPWQLLIPYILAALLPSIIRTYYEWTQSYQGPAPFWIGIVFRMGLFLIALFWTLDAADDADWFGVEDKDLLKTVKIAVAQLVLAIAVVGGCVTLFCVDPCLRVKISHEDESPSNGSSPTRKSTTTTDARTSRPTATIIGTNNAYGSRYFLFIILFSLGLILLQKPMGNLSLGILLWQILCLLEILSPAISSSTNNLSTSAIPPIILAMLGNYHFFKTGHQATLSSIQWESAFIPLREVTYPWSPILVLCNTFGAQILCTLSVPLLVLWRRRGRPPPKDSTDGMEVSTQSMEVSKQDMLVSKQDMLVSKQSMGVSKQSSVIREVGKSMAIYLLFHATIGLATSVWASWLRRHLMLFRIFSPRWMMASVVLLVCDVVGIVGAVGVGVRWNVDSAGRVFGWG